MVNDALVTAPQQPRGFATRVSWIAKDALLKSTFMGRGTIGQLHFKKKSC